MTNLPEIRAALERLPSYKSNPELLLGPLEFFALLNGADTPLEQKARLTKVWAEYGTRLREIWDLDFYDDLLATKQRDPGWERALERLVGRINWKLHSMEAHRAMAKEASERSQNKAQVKCDILAEAVLRVLDTVETPQRIFTWVRTSGGRVRLVENDGSPLKAQPWKLNSYILKIWFHNRVCRAAEKILTDLHGTIEHSRFDELESRPDTAHDPSVLLERMVEASDVLALLSPREREIMQLLNEGRTPSEVAAKFNVSPNTVYATKAHAKHKLRNYWENRQSA